MGTYKFFQAKLTFLKRKCLQRPTHSLQLQAYQFLVIHIYHKMNSMLLITTLFSNGIQMNLHRLVNLLPDIILVRFFIITFKIIIANTSNHLFMLIKNCLKLITKHIISLIQCYGGYYPHSTREN